VIIYERLVYTKERNLFTHSNAVRFSRRWMISRVGISYRKMKTKKKMMITIIIIIIVVICIRFLSEHIKKN